MCLSKVYYCQNGQETLITNNSVNISYNKELVTVIDLLQKKYEMQGHIANVDLENNIIMIEG